MMLPCAVWQGLDRLGFLENAILLETKARSQGKLAKAPSSRHDRDVVLDKHLSHQLVRDFLDDFALFTAGAGGRDNVSAACLEISNQNQILVRVARNAGLDEPTLLDLNSLVKTMTGSIPTVASTIDQRQEDILLKVLARCNIRLLEHVDGFLNELRQARCRPTDQCEYPAYGSKGAKTENSTDVERLGKRCLENHTLYMQTCNDRLHLLRELSSELRHPSNRSNLQKMMDLTRIAYEVRQSSSFRLFLEFNVQHTKKAEAVISTVVNLVERLGKIARLFRAAMTLNVVGMTLVTNGINIRVQGISPMRMEIRDMASRTPDQLRLRGGRSFSSCATSQLQNKINRWQSYRVHCEIQLIVFYQENPSIELYNNWIGGNKISCFLCHSFITIHGQFEVMGCHQSLYSLWTVPDIIAFENQERADAFRRALGSLCKILEHKMTILRKSNESRWKYPFNNESIANLSRVSLPILFPSAEQSLPIPVDNEGSILEEQALDMEKELFAVAQGNFTTTANASAEEPPHSNTGIEKQVEQGQKRPLLVDELAKIPKLEVSPRFSASILTEATIEAPNDQVDRRDMEKVQPDAPSNHRRRRRRRSNGYGKRHAQHRRPRTESVTHQNSKRNYHAAFPARKEARHPTSRSHQSHIKGADGRRRWRESDHSGQQYRNGLASSQTTQPKHDGFGWIGALCYLFTGRCFARSRKAA